MKSCVRPMAMLAVALGAMTAGCGEDPDPIGPNDTLIRVTVRLDASGEPGIQVELFATGGTTALESGETNASGVVEFDELDPGSYEVGIEVPAGTEMESGEARRGVTATEGQTAAVTFELVTSLPPGLEVVNLTGSSFSPAEITIDVGETIRWVNNSGIAHTVTPDGHSEWTNTNLDTGSTFEHTFDAAGAYPYLCQFHAGMVGTVTVQ